MAGYVNSCEVCPVYTLWCIYDIEMRYVLVTVRGHMLL